MSGSTDIVKSHWSLCDGAREAARLLCPKNGTIIELGSGEGTSRLTRFGTVHAVEHDEKWLLGHPRVKYIHAPLTPSAPICGMDFSEWYDPAVLKENLPTTADLVIVDGPPAAIGRGGLLNNLSLFPIGAVWLIDDTLRREDTILADAIAMRLRLLTYRFWNFTILAPEPLPSNILSIIHGASWRVLEGEDDDYVRKYHPHWSGTK